MSYPLNAVRDRHDPSLAQGDRIDRLVAAHTEGKALERPFYMDEDIYQRDLERVFHRHWHCIAHENAIPNPNDFEVFHLADEQVILTRDAEGQLHALLNVCRHRGAEVCTAKKGNQKAFVCPYHAWTYGNDGRLKAARLMPKDFKREDHGLKKLHLRVVAGLVFISFAQTPLDFSDIDRLVSETCGQYGWGDAKIAHRQNYHIEANWKLAVENYVECYHCGPAHPEYSQTHALEQPLDKIEGMNAAMEARTCALGVTIGQGDLWQNSAQGREAIHAFRYALYEGVETGSEDGKALAPLMGKFADFDGGVTSIHLGGTTFLVCYPDHGMIYRFIPTGPHSSEMELIWLVNKEAQSGQDYDHEKLIWLWTVTTDEDKAIIEHTARGVKSKFYTPGPIAPMEQNELRYIGWYLDEISRA